MAHSHSSQLEEGHGSVGGYVAGFILSVLLTAASFGLVMEGVLSPHATVFATPA